MLRSTVITLWLVLSVYSIATPQETLAEKSFVQSPSVVKRDRPLKINHPAGTKIQAIFANAERGVVSWVYLSEDHFDRSSTFTIFVAPPGEYLITTGESTIVKVIEEGIPGPKPTPSPPDPKPDPDPNPTPSPQPSPKLKLEWAVWIYEQADAINQVPETNTRLSIETRRFLESRGIKLVAYDDDQEAAKAKPFLAAAGDLPSLLLMQDSTKYVVRKAPKSLDELKAMIKEVTGE
jgi:hypothetical protein